MRKYISNTSWLVFEKIASMGLGFLMTVLVARYLGAHDFGTLAYTTALVAIFATAGHMGLSGLVVRELVAKPNNAALIMGTSFFLKFIGIFLGFIALIIFTYFSEERYSNEFWILIIAASSLLLKPFELLEFWFASKVQSKYSAVSRFFSVAFISIFKIFLIIFGAGLLAFISMLFFQAIIFCVLLYYFYQQMESVPIKKWRITTRYLKELSSQAWVVFLGALFATIYFKIDQVMLQWLIGPEEVGMYAVAATLSEAWYFLPSAIVASFFPRLIELHEIRKQNFEANMQKLFDLLFWLAFCMAFIITFVASPLITFFFSFEYLQAAEILVIHIWAALFIFMRALLSRWILIENILIFSLLTQGLGAMTNVILNLWLIPHYGGLGAAYATLVSYAAASYISLVFYKKTRGVFWMMTKSFFAPFRYSFAFVSRKV